MKYLCPYVLLSMSDNFLVFICKQQLFFFKHSPREFPLHVNEKGIQIDETIRNSSYGNDRLRRALSCHLTTQVPVSNHQVLNYHVTIDQQPKSLIPWMLSWYIPTRYSGVTRKRFGFTVLFYTYIIHMTLINSII